MIITQYDIEKQYTCTYFQNYSLANINSEGHVTWFDAFKKPKYTPTEDIISIFDTIDTFSEKELEDYTKNNKWNSFLDDQKIKSKAAKESLQRFFDSTEFPDKSLDSFTEYNNQLLQTNKNAKLAAIGTKALNVAMNTSITLLASLAISKAIDLWQDYSHAQEEALEKAQEAQSAMDSLREKNVAQNELVNNTDLLEEYKTLAQGVDSQGNNLTLNTTEFERYNEISNQIADTFPTLVMGFSNTGGAILSCKDNMAALNEEMEKLNLQYLADMEKDFKDVFEGYQKQVDNDPWWSTEGNHAGYKQQLEAINNLLDAANSSNAFKIDYGTHNPFSLTPELDTVLEAVGIDNLDYTKAQLDSMRNKEMSEEFKNYLRQISNYSNTLKSTMDQYQSTIKQYVKQFYAGMDTDSNRKQASDILLDGIDLWSGAFEGKSADEITSIIKSQLYTPLTDAASSAIVDAYEGMGKFQNGDITLADYSKIVKPAQDAMTELQESGQLVEGAYESFSQTFYGVSKDGVKYTDSLSSAIDKISEKFKGNQDLIDEIKQGLNSLTLDEITNLGNINLDDLDIDYSTIDSWKDFSAVINKANAALKDTDIHAKPQLESLNELLSSYSSGEATDTDGAIKSISTILQQAKELYDNRDYGTGQFQSITSWLTDGLTSAEAYDAAMDKIDEVIAYTEEGAIDLNATHDKFLDKLSEVGYTTRDSSGNVIVKAIGDMDTLADKLGINKELAASLIELLQTKSNNIIAFDGIKEGEDTLQSQYTELNNLYQLLYEEQSKPENQRDTERIDEINDSINTVKTNIQNTIDLLDELYNKDGEPSNTDGRTNFEKYNDTLTASYASWASNRDSVSAEKNLREQVQNAVERELTDEEWSNLIQNFGFDKFDPSTPIVEQAEQFIETCKTTFYEAGQEAGNSFKEGYESTKSSGADTNQQIIDLAQGATYANSDNVDVKTGAKQDLADLNKLKTDLNLTEEEIEEILNSNDQGLTYEVTVDKEGLITEVKETTSKAQAEADNNPVEVKTDTTEAENNIVSLGSNLTTLLKNLSNADSTVTVTVEDGIAYATINDIKYQVTTLPDGNIKLTTEDGASVVLSKVNGQLQVVSEGANGDIKINAGNSTTVLDNIVRQLGLVTDKTVYVNVNKTETTTRKFIGPIQSDSLTLSEANGTAQVSGNARVGGNWGEKSNGKALVGELGQELIVRGNHYFSVGDNGAEFVNLKKGDIVFNHLQTEALLSKGYVTGRGRALVQGNARAMAGKTQYMRDTNPELFSTSGTSNTNKSSSDSKSSKKSSNKKAQTNDNIYNWWDAYLEGAKSNLSNFQSELDKLNEQYQDAIAHGNDEAMRILEKRIKESTDKYAKNYMDAYNELGLDLQENLNALANIRPEFKGKSALDIINDETLNTQITKDYEDRLAATTDEDEKSKLQKEFDTYKSYLSSLESIYSEMSSMEENFRTVWDETKLKGVRVAVEAFNSGDLSQVTELAAKYGYESAEAFVDAWNRQDPDLMGWFKKIEFKDDTVLQNSISRYQKALDNNEFTSSLLEGDVNSIDKRIELAKKNQELYHQMANAYRDANYDEDAEEIRDLQASWRECNEEIVELYEQKFEAQKDLIQQQIDESDWMLDMYGEEDYGNRIKETNNQLGIQLNMFQQLSSEQKEIDALYKQGTMSYDDWVEKTRELKSDSTSILSDIKSLVESLKQMEIDKIQDQIDDVQEASEEVTDELEEQIDKLNEQKELLEDELDDWGNALEAVKKVVNEQIDALNESKESSSEYWNDQIDAAKNLNDETERTVSLLRAKGEVEKRQSQKSSLIYQNGRFVYMANQSNVDDARRDYEDTYREVSQERAIELLEESRDLELKSYEDRIKALEDYLDKLNEVTEKYTDEVNDLAAQELLGSDYQEEATNLSLSLLDKLENGYYKTESQIEGYINKRIDKLQKQIDAENKATDATVKNLEKQIDAIEDSDDAFNEFYETIVTMFKNGDEESIPGVIEAFVEKLPTILDGIDCSIITQKFEDAINNVDANIEIKVDGTGGGNTSSGDLPETPSSGDNNSGSNSGGNNQSTTGKTDNDRLQEARDFAKAWASESDKRSYSLHIYDSKTEGLNSEKGKLTEAKPTRAFIYTAGGTYYVAKAQLGGGTDAPTLAKYAKGTDNAKAGAALLGEEGPEIKVMNGGESIITNDNVKALANNMEDFIELTPENNPWYDFVVGNKKLDFSTIDSRDMQKNMLKGFVGNVPEVRNVANNTYNFDVTMNEVDNIGGFVREFKRQIGPISAQLLNAKR